MSVCDDSYTMGDVYRDWNHAKKIKKESNLKASIDILEKCNVPYQKLTDYHLRIGDFDYWPSTGCFINRIHKIKNRGVFRLLKLLGVNYEKSTIKF